MGKPLLWIFFTQKVNFEMMTNDVLEAILRVDNEAGAHPGEEGCPGEHSAALGGPGWHVPGVTPLSDHQDELVTPGNGENMFLSCF